MAKLSGQVFICADCDTPLMVRSLGVMSGQIDGEWFMVKAAVWNEAQRDRPCRFLCVGCLEQRLSRKLTHRDFLRSARVNFVGKKTPRLRRRLRELKPARRMVHTRFAA